ncbi:hypothetical protein [uncultured Cohaesibacter sp.]|uniref:hypothetical protein n=1 Tax=uncultured Cohaesibacter sp. TaxID=1002546 RepID=UPI00292D0F52|nr:hypothetical protein [uncultured Cohaesibacter sp.]
MKKHLVFIRENLVDIIVLSVSIPLAILDLIPSDLLFFEPSTDHMIAFLLLAVSGLVFSQMRNDPKRIHERFSETNQILSNFTFFQSARTTSVAPTEHPEIWEGFIGNYFAVNAPWLLETSDDQQLESMVEVHAARYSEPQFGKAFYVFYSKGARGCYFPKAVSRFVMFGKCLMEKNPEVSSKIRVLLLDEDAPAYTLFLGDKMLSFEGSLHKEKVSVFYVNQKPLVRETGFPNIAFVSIDTKLNSIFEQDANRIIQENLESFIDLPTFISQNDREDIAPQP